MYNFVNMFNLLIFYLIRTIRTLVCAILRKYHTQIFKILWQARESFSEAGDAMEIDSEVETEEDSDGEIASESH